MRKCVLCSKNILEEDMKIAVPYKGRYAHKECFDIAIRAIKKDKDEELEEKKKKKETDSKAKKKSTKTPKAELKEGMSDEEYKEKREYYNYLKKILNTEKLSAKVYTLSEKYLTQFEWSWTGMREALVYLHEIKEKEITGDVVGLLPYIYEESQDFFKEVKRVENSNKDAALSDMYHTRRIVYRKRPQKAFEDLVIESIPKSET